MKILWPSIVVASFLFSGCEGEKGRLEREAKAALTEVMIDPTAILVRNLRYGRKDGAVSTICGEVNGKNQLGGYVGFRPFVAKLSAPAVIIVDNDISPRDFDYSYDQRLEQQAYLELHDRLCASSTEQLAYAKEKAEQARIDADNEAYWRREDAKRAEQRVRLDAEVAKAERDAADRRNQTEEDLKELLRQHNAPPQPLVRSDVLLEKMQNSFED